MKHRSILLICTLAAILLIYPGCQFIKAKAPSSSNPPVSTEPLTGNWAMTRVSIDPSLPSEIPGFIVDQIFAKSITWSISMSGDKLKIKYGNKAIWFNSMGIEVTPKMVSVSEAADKKSYTFSGGGDIHEDTLPGVLSMIAVAAGNPKDISISYTDQVQVTLISQDQIRAAITYSASGTYKNNKGPGNLSNASTLTYTGTRK